MSAPVPLGRSRRVHGSRHGSVDAAIAVTICAAAAAAALLLPGLPPLAMLAAGAVAGAALERHRQAGREQPLRLGETPSAWATWVRESVGLGYALVGAFAAAAALAVLLAPSLSGTGRAEKPAALTGRAVSIGRSSLPAVRVLRRAPRAAFRVKGVSFRVFALAAAQTDTAPGQRPAGRGLRWLRVGVDSRNLARARFRPSVVTYRLEDERDRSYWPDIGGGTGPASLGQTGFLARGELFRSRLAFRVPRSARRLTLVFEPVPDGSVQVKVPLGWNGFE